MSVVVEFCQSNLASGSDVVRDALMEDPDLDIEIMEYGCLGNCEQCLVQLFALVNGDIIAGDNPKELLANIKQAIAKKQQEDEEWRKLGF